MKNILLVELWGLGDLVMMSVVLSSLRRAYPHAKITLLAKPHAEELFKYDDRIDEFIVFDPPWTVFKGKYRLWKWHFSGMYRIIKRIRKEHFDLCLDARGDVRNYIFLYFCGIKKKMYQHNRRIGVHRSEAWEELLSYLDIDAIESGPELKITDADKLKARQLLKDKFSGDEDYVLLHPGARIATRCWPMERFVSVARHIFKTYGIKVIVLEDGTGYGDRFVDVAGVYVVKVELRSVMGLLSLARLLVCNDGGIMHIADALGCVVVSIFGPTDHVRFGPFNNKENIVIEDGYSCRPCFDNCKKGDPECISRISLRSVLDKIDGLFEEMR